MSRNPRIEEILEAWWEWEHCEISKRLEAKKRVDKLVDDIIGKNPVSREQVLDFLWGHYLEYRKTRRSNEKIQIARSEKTPPKSSL